MYYYKLESFDYDEHWTAFYVSNKKYSDDEFKKIVKDAYIETCKHISENQKPVSKFNYMIDSVIFDILQESDKDKSQPCHYFNRILKDRHDLINLDDCLDSKLEFVEQNGGNDNLREFYDKRSEYILVGISDDDNKGYI
ncbi:hypothetical protein mru_0985 [Methanobrevibacter ruminantium M1]|uniref:Uncharacterized protein n=1 Tax=Methanobrevibacter ruminantium (strain ATCC 35063 / DSM 1093 / JCM 13430 / OCM 146 / M1) TaxID=634498 RepID=D3E2S5_METRM|nr:hypothetical protein [Methanobrevibacter ruminantium]ADC46836.1 hypothetical protein mru_0985 [Methanobrevibacter ruminantium M1]